MKTHLLALTLLLALGAPAFAEEDPAFMQHFFAPELVLKHAREIGLSAQQRSAITKDIGRVTGDTTTLQLSMLEGFGTIEDLAAADPVNEQALLDAIHDVLTAELEVKEAHMGLLIRIRNLLTEEQREKMKRLRDA